jgi:hypothetical protein
LARTSKKKPVAKKSAAARRGARGTMPAAATHQAKIRMYRQGLGDCFLISLPRTGTSKRPYYVMIDCGVILGTADPGTIMTKVIENIVEVTGGKIDLLIATHEHWDHLSGFVQAKESFDKLKVGEVWLGWTEDPNDELTQKLKREKGLALAALRMGLSHLQIAGDSDTATELGGILEFFGAARGATTGDALDNVRGKTTKPRYCLPSDAPVRPPGVAARFYVLGPPHDEKQLRKINPSAREGDLRPGARRIPDVHGRGRNRIGRRRQRPAIRSAVRNSLRLCQRGSRAGVLPATLLAAGWRGRGPMAAYRYRLARRFHGDGPSTR